MVAFDVEDISTDTMKRPSLARQGSIKMKAQMESPKAQKVQLVFNFFAGLALPIYAYITFSTYGEQQCDMPVANWLWTYAWVGFVTGAVGMYINVSKLMIAGTQITALPETDAEQAVAAKVGCLSCLGCCVLLPLSMFSFFWWFKGNFDVWGTYPRYDIDPNEPISSFSGCGAELLGGARLIFIITYVLMGLGCCCLSMVCVFAMATRDSTDLV
jgi:hypothetical protein